MSSDMKETLSGGPPGDGIDIDSTQDFIVENSYINCEDDSLCVKSGLDALGRTYARPSRDGVFRNNYLGRGGGLTIGSEGSGGVFNITCALPLLSWSSCANRTPLFVDMRTLSSLNFIAVPKCNLF